VDRLIWDHHKARGVRIAAEGEGTDLFASKGVVLCAGAVATPTILLRSGVGPRVELTRHDIDVRIDAPAIGNHLRDHLIMPVVFEKVPSSPAFRANASVRDLARWMTMGSGPVASNLAECGGLTRDQTVQVHVTPTHYLTYPNQDATPAMTIGVNLTQPQSSGHIRLGTKSPLESPVITPNYLAQPADLDGTIRAVHLAREIAQRMPLSESLRAELVPGSQRLDDEQIARSIRRYAQTLYHPVGTCRMGRETDAPIDGDFALREADQLWVADASILPGLTVGNPNAMVMTLAWIAAERIACQL
jgi:choline dehydrogenase